MTFEGAPYFADVANGPEEGAAYWAKTSDGIRVRVGLWPVDGAKGTLLLFPGRTEYIEKYALFAKEMAAAGYAVVTIDWRGQGLADRLLQDPRIGHVGEFPDYQKDVASLVAVARAFDMPRPWHLLGHSMGGAIALRAAMEGIDVVSATFTGPMWGILMSPGMRKLALGLNVVSRWVGLGHKLPPTTDYENYVVASAFKGNTLTNNEEMWDYMKAQVTAHPELTIGGPSIRWVGEALRECDALMAAPAPSLPAICFVGEDEAIVDREAMRRRMANWAGGSYQVIHNAQHEVIMEGPETRAHVIQQMLDVFAQGESQANVQRGGAPD